MKTLKIFLTIFLFGLLSYICLCGTSIGRLNVSETKWQWIRRMILDKPRQKVDYAIIGSSRAWNGIKANRMSAALGGKAVWNLGRNWIGRDADYIIVKNLLQNHEIKHLLIEFIGAESNKIHFYSKYLITPEDYMEELEYKMKIMDLFPEEKDVQWHKSLLNNYFSHIFEFATRTYRISALEGVQRLFKKDKENECIAKNDQTNGFYIESDLLTQTKEFVDEYENIPIYRPFIKGEEAVLKGSTPDYYLQKIKRLADQYDVELSFVFMPEYRIFLPSDQMFAYLDEMGDVLIPDLYEVYKYEYYRDVHHVYQKGSDVYTDALSELLIHGPEYSRFYQMYK